MPHGLTVLAAIRRGEEDALRQVLRGIGDDIKGKTLAARPRPHIDFPRSRRIHFARFAVLDDPDRGPARARLLFSTNYDGDLESHLAEVTSITSDMQAIWGSCEAYSGVESFPAFVRAHAHQPEAFYIAYREENVEQIQSAIAARRRLEGAPAVAGRRVPLLERIVRALPIGGDVARAVKRAGLANVYNGTNRIVASLNRYLVFRFANWLTSNTMPARQSLHTSVAIDNCVPRDLDGLPHTHPPPTFREDVVTQNQLTLVTEVDPRHVDRVKAVMSAIDSYAKRLSPPGSLIGISTIHFVRWLLIDDDTRLVMLSDYDGSWESYIDEFAEMILSGLDAIWETSFGYPPDGARDLPAFKRFLRTHQFPAEIFFSAYPDATILNIANDLSHQS
jgi:hypothetical protein